MSRQGTGREVEHELAERHGFDVRGRGARRVVRRLAPQHRVDAGEQFARVERFREIVVGPHLEADDAVDVLALGRQHHDRGVVVGAAQPAHDREPILPRHHQVEDQQVEPLAHPQPVHRRPAVGGDDREAVVAQVAAQQVPQARVVVDDEDLRWTVARHGVRA
jgi:hypothetical protein